MVAAAPRLLSIRAMNFSRLAFPSASLLALVAACGGDGAEPADVRARLQTTLPALIESTGSAMAYLDESESLAGVDRTLESIDRAFALPFDLAATDERLAAAAEGELDGEELAAALGEAIFNESNHEGGGVYRIPPELLCGEDLETGAVDPECIDTMTAVALKIRVAERDGGLDFTLLVGPDRDEPLAVELRSDRASFVVDLAEAKQAALAVGEAVGEPVELPEIMEGVVAASLTVLGEAHVELDLATRSAVQIAGDFDGDAVAFTTAARQPIIAFEVDAVARQIGLSLDLGATTLTAPWSLIDDTSLASGVFALDWKGMSARATIAEGDTGIELEDIGFGDGTSTIKLDDQTLFALDLNAALGRRFAVSIQPTEGGLPTFALSPGFDLSLAFNLAPLAAAGDFVESYLLGETYRVALLGDAPEIQPIEADASFAGGLAVLGGELSIGSSAVAAPVVAGVGECLVGDPVTDGEHPILGAFAVAACP